jgi:hypothetical protein
MRWVIVDDSSDKTIYGRVDDDGLMRVTCVAEHPEFAAWVAAGNSPEPWEG